MAQSRRALIVLLTVTLFVAGIFLGFKVSRLLVAPQPQRMFDTPALLKQVQTLSELVTVKYVIEKAEVWNDPPQNVLAQFVAGDNYILLLAHGVVKAGVNFSQIKTEDLHIQGKTIYVKLPHAQITDAYLDDKLTKVIERKTGFLRSFDKDLEQNIRQVAVQDMRSVAWRGGIIKDADERARAQLASFFSQMGFEKVEFPLDGVPLPASFGNEKN